MSIAVICPRCQTTFPISDDLADGPVCCSKCANVFQRSASAGIQAGAPPSASKSAPPRNDRDDDEPMPPSRPHASPRVPFPTVSLLILVCGVLFLLLVLSVGFNIWVFVHPDLRNDRHAQQAILADEQAQVAQQQAEIARVQAELMRARAVQARQEVQQEDAKLKRELEDLRRELEAVREQLEDAKRKLPKEK